MSQSDLHFQELVFENPCGHSMYAIYYVQVEGNQEWINCMEKVIAENDVGSIRFRNIIPEQKVLQMLDNSETFFTFAHADIVEMKMLSGILNPLPELKEQTVEEWFEENLESVKSPDWESVCKSVVGSSMGNPQPKSCRTCCIPNQTAKKPEVKSEATGDCNGKSADSSAKRKKPQAVPKNAKKQKEREPCTVCDCTNYPNCAYDEEPCDFCMLMNDDGVTWNHTE